MRVGIDMWMRNGTRITVHADSSEELLQAARHIYDSFHESIWQSLRP